MSSDWADASAGTPHVPTQQHQVDDLLNRCNGLPLLRQTHRPASNHRLRLQYDGRDLLDLRSCDSALRHDLVPGSGRDRSAEVLEANGLLIDERVVDSARTARVFFQDLFAQSFEKGEVAAQTNLNEMLGDFRARAKKMENILSLLETGEADFGKRVH